MVVEHRGSSQVWQADRPKTAGHLSRRIRALQETEPSLRLREPAARELWRPPPERRKGRREGTAAIKHDKNAAIIGAPDQPPVGPGAAAAGLCDRRNPRRQNTDFRARCITSGRGQGTRSKTMRRNDRPGISTPSAHRQSVPRRHESSSARKMSTSVAVDIRVEHAGRAVEAPRASSAGATR